MARVLDSSANDPTLVGVGQQIGRAFCCAPFAALGAQDDRDKQAGVGLRTKEVRGWSSYRV